ncbi:hypothetical protein F0562_005420 [Nyssa sinensis]|uniref:BHLH domain-containing protein n=1 Tax=Nyssa sinensis TaxID=561372 RepID=A0A5J5ALW4_9ASTE|nr:hypothetical protein F0562_005420 [Nyssa sinensis]
MALAKDRTPHDSRMGLLQASTYYGNVFGGSSVQVPDLSSPGHQGFQEYHKTVLEEGDSSEKATGFFKNSTGSSLSSPSSTNSDGFVYQATNFRPEEAHSVINFKTGNNNFMHAGGSVLSFQQNEDNLNHNYHHQHSKCASPPRLLEDFNCIQTASNYGYMSNTKKENQYGKEPFGWLDSEADIASDTIQDFGAEEGCFRKRPHAGESMQAFKKQCTSATRKPKPKSTPSKDPQSIAAKNRRERISERLKILQDLVPNGSKVDLVTMLEKAISYVKFLQLQVKVLATDEFWPVQGGKAPELAQVKEAIDAILSSQGDRNSGSK